jgi:aminopeptidase N
MTAGFFGALFATVAGLVAMCPALAFASPQTPESRPASAPAEKAPFLDSGPNAWADRACDLQHLDFEIWFDLENRSIRGIVKQKLVVLQESLREVPFDAEELQPTKALVNGRNATFRSTGTQIFVEVPGGAKSGELLETVIYYEGSPTTGLHWSGPEKGYEKKWLQCYSQGQSQNNRHWIPMHDYPNDRTTWSCTLHVPKGFTAVGNGRFLGVSDDAEGGTQSFRYAMEKPNCTYLISVAIGPWERYARDWNGVPVEYYVGPGVGEETALRSFGATPNMMEFFSKWIGVPYPWAKYSQTAVTEFVTGGMENVSATTQTDLTLHDARSHLERDSDGLVAHELAHQWWGDLLTCNGWRHLWLNEGFATYFTALWVEHDKGVDDYKLYMDGQRNGFLSADPAAYGRALVTQAFNRTNDAANSNVYTKGSSVLHMLRFVIGDELFQKSLQLYCQRHREGLVETRDLERAVADVSGQGLEWFWQEWVYLHGNPILGVSNTFDAARKICVVTVRQTQKVTPLVPIFKMPVNLLVWHEDGRQEIRKVWIDAAENRYEIPADAKPRFVRFDEGAWLAAVVKHEKPLDEWMHQALLDPDAVGQRLACIALGKLAETCPDGDAPGPVDVFHHLFRGSPRATVHRDVKVAAADALAAYVRKFPFIKDQALAALKVGIADSSAVVRRAAAKALGAMTAGKDAELCELLKKVATSDEAWGPRAESLRSLGAILGADAWSFYEEMAAVPSDRDTLRIAAVGVMQTVDARRAVAHLMRAARVGEMYETRLFAVPALAKLLKDAKTADYFTEEQRAEAIDSVTSAASSNHFRLRGAARRALSGWNDPKIVTFLEGLLGGRLSAPEKKEIEDLLKAARQPQKK